MRPLAELASAACAAMRGVFCDIDDTLTTDGRITAEAYAALERLYRAGLLVVPVTGRPAGWCDHIARMWPVSAVVGENGAFYFRYDARERRMLRSFVADDGIRQRDRERLHEVAAEVLAEVRGAAVASDQAYRETDLAIDFCEDVPRLPDAAVDQIVALMEKRGLTVKVSSIHVNGWFGTYDKLAMTRKLMREVYDIDLDRDRGCYAFLGDSPNDAPMFQYFPNAIGVANVRAFGARVHVLPAYVTREPYGSGFREAADHLLAGRCPTCAP